MLTAATGPPRTLPAEREKQSPWRLVMVGIMSISPAGGRHVVIDGIGRCRYTCARSLRLVQVAHLRFCGLYSFRTRAICSEFVGNDLQREFRHLVRRRNTSLGQLHLCAAHVLVRDVRQEMF